MDFKDIIRKVSKILPDRLYLELKWFQRMGYILNINNPQTFNEKLQWLKLYYRKPELSILVDKYEVKNYIANKIGSEYIIPTLGVWNQFDEIDFNQLPEQFVLKCTHDSGGLSICRSKLDFDRGEAKVRISNCLKTNYYYHTREWPYKNVKPRIICEPLLKDEKTQDLRDYKFFCFNGEVKVFKIDFDRFIDHHANYYSREGNLLPFGEEKFPPIYDRELKMPVQLNKMIDLAEELSSGIPFVRVDFYECNGNVYFGELTFFPAAGCSRFTDNEWDKKLGEWLILPKK